MMRARAVAGMRALMCAPHYLSGSALADAPDAGGKLVTVPLS